MSSATSFAKYDPLVSLVNALQYKSCASTISCEESWLALQREPLFNLSYNTISESRSLAGVASQYSVVARYQPSSIFRVLAPMDVSNELNLYPRDVRQNSQLHRRFPHPWKRKRAQLKYLTAPLHQSSRKY